MKDFNKNEMDGILKEGYEVDWGPIHEK